MNAAQNFSVTVRIEATGFTSEISSGRHSLQADEPESVGGTDSGPTPYDFLLASLGTCIVMTLRMYADRKGWPLSGRLVALRHDRIHARECAECDTDADNVSRIRKLVTLDGDLNDPQRDRLLEIADRCPVHRTLTSEIQITTDFESAWTPATVWVGTQSELSNMLVVFPFNDQWHNQIRGRPRRRRKEWRDYLVDERNTSRERALTPSSNSDKSKGP